MDDIGKSVVAQRCGYKLNAGAVYRGVDDFEVVVTLDDFGVQGEALDCSQEGFVDVGTDVLYQLGIALELDVTYIGDFVDVVDDIDIVRSKYLCAVSPVGFVSVVFFRVVGCGNVYAALASEMTYGEGQLGGGLEGLEEIYLDTVGREDVCYGLGKVFGVIAHVVTYDYRNLGQVCKGLLEIVGQTLRSGTYGIDIHAVGTGAHDAAQSACTEFKVFVE